MMKMNLTLAASDLEKSRLFYRDILGLKTEGNEEDAYFIVCFANIKVVFQPVAILERQHPVFLQHINRSTLGVGVQFELDCPNLSEIETLLNRCQWPIIYELDDIEHQRREIWIQDPDGYLVVLNGE
jgi:catechol 2,3-dioxygenase-like lactoylglutathione lyase family enzyme